ncbi:MAG: RDD family protein [Kiritimatiellae bacterium]|jgi:uncharacterized RDD family membrane protein YckC|nr:RDD family protein [Kiritimatiellia bacterium]
MKYAGFWKRCAACWIDYVVVTLVICGIAIVSDPLFPDGFVERDDHDPIVLTILIIITIIVFIGLPVLYASLLESSKRQGTLGKIALGLVVVDSDGNRISFARSIVRNIQKVINLFIPPLYFLFFAIPMSKKKQALYDRVARTFVVEVKTKEHTTSGCTL